jgi:hypothetical protein
MKIRPLGAELLHADRQTVTAEVMVVFFCNFANAPKNLVPTSQRTHSVSVIQTSQLMLYSEIIAVCSEIHTKHINTVRTAQ